MEEILKLLKKQKTIRIMINIFFIAPIFILTHIVYILFFGSYTIKLSVNMLYNPNTYIALSIFSGILFSSHLIESNLMPFITRIKSIGKAYKNDFDFKEFIDDFSFKIFGLGSKELNFCIKNERNEIMSYMYKIPTALFMYSFIFLWLKTYYIFIILLMLSIYVYISMFKTLSTCIKVIDFKDNISEE